MKVNRQREHLFVFNVSLTLLRPYRLVYSVRKHFLVYLQR